MTGRPTAPRKKLVAAGLGLLVVAVGAFAAVRLLSMGDQRLFAGADVDRVVNAPLAAIPQLVVGEVGADLDYLVTGDRFEAVDIVLRTSPITHSVNIADEELRIALMTRLFAGLEAAKLRFYDAVDASGKALPVTAPGGSSFTILAATYADVPTAQDAYAAHVSSYETWEFGSGRESWSHGDESAAVAYGTTSRPHGRCYVLTSASGCDLRLRVFRVGNLVVTVLSEGQGPVTVDELLVAIDDAIAAAP